MEQLNCHKCEYSGKKSQQCLSCAKGEQTLKYRQYICEGYDAPQQDTSCSDQCTALPADVEDTLRKFLFDLFDLTDNELLCLKYIMNGKSLIEFANSMEKAAEKNSTFSRHRAFQTRKAILKKLGKSIAPALLTLGQKKELKED